MNGAFNPQFARVTLFHTHKHMMVGVIGGDRILYIVPPTHQETLIIIIKCAAGEHFRLLLNDFTLSPAEELMIELKWWFW